MFTAVAWEGQSIKQSLLRGYKIAFMINMRYIRCVGMCIMVFFGQQAMITMVAKE